MGKYGSGWTVGSMRTNSVATPANPSLLEASR
jgi:hypothetical protein